MMIEQPLCYDDIYHHSLLQQQINTPICLDESIRNLNDAKTAVEVVPKKLDRFKVLYERIV
jgi:O-succinylbenzoate synthase